GGRKRRPAKWLWRRPASRGGEGPGVGSANSLSDKTPIVMFTHKLVAVLAQALPQCGVAEQFEEPLRQGLAGVRCDQQRIFPVHEAGARRAGEQHARFFRRQVIQQLDGKPGSARTWNHLDIASGETVANLGQRLWIGEYDLLLNPELLGTLPNIGHM